MGEQFHAADDPVAAFCSTIVLLVFAWGALTFAQFGMVWESVVFFAFMFVWAVFMTAGFRGLRRRLQGGNDD